MGGKHTKKKTPAHSAASRTESRAGGRSGNVYVVAPEYDDYERDLRRSAAAKKRSGGAWIRFVVVVIALFAAAAAAGGLYLSRLNRVAELDTIYPNVSINDIDVGGLTMEEAVQKLLDSGVDPYRGKSVTVRLPMEKTLTITAEELGLGSDVTAAAESAYGYGRDGTLLENYRTYQACTKKAVSMLWEIHPTLDETALRQKIDAAVSELNASLLDSSAEIGEDGVTLTKGMNAENVDGEAVFERVRAAFENQAWDDIVVELVTIEADGADADEELLQSVYDAIHTEPVNARYDKETGGIIEGVQGVSFDLEQAKELWAAARPGEEVFLPFVFTDPKVKDLEEGLFADMLAQTTTSLSGSSSARINNIELAAAAMNDTVLNPGETFDYNSCLGQRTAARGYQEAGAYSGGKHVSELGGGICQGSSTLYYSALKANLQITVRHNHYFVVSYLPRGIDATVSWGGPDFRFVNNRDYPIKIKSFLSDGELYVQIWGTDVDGSRVEITSETWEDDEYYYAQTYRNVYAADGTLLSSEKEAFSDYHKYEADDGPDEEDEYVPADVPAAADTPAPTTAPTPEPADTPEPTPEPTAPPAAAEEEPASPDEAGE